MHIHLSPALPIALMSLQLVPFPDNGSATSDSEFSEPGWAWTSCVPSDGDEVYVSALQLLGIDLANAVPPRTRLMAIKPVQEQPEIDLLVGTYGKSTTKERLLKLS